MSLNEKEWFTEIYEDRTGFSVRITDKLFDRESPFQRVEIFQSESMGKILILNGCFMVTEKDAVIYHEMLVQPAMHIAPNPRRALVIGGGDGGAVGQAIKHKSLESVTLCEIDPLVVESCREHIPSVSSGLDDPRVTVLFEDGAQFIKRHPKHFDLVFVDSTDPVGPAKTLFEPEFFEDVKLSLTDNGIAVFQTESPLFMEDVFVDAVKNLRSVFGEKSAYPYTATIPCYPGGLWSFTLCSGSLDPLSLHADRLDPQLERELEYYTVEIHKAAFALPAFARRRLFEEA